MVLKTSPVSCLIAAPILAVLLLELSLLLNSDKIGGKANRRQMQPALGEHSCIYFLHPRVSCAFTLASLCPVPLLLSCVCSFAKGMVLCTVSAVFTPTVPSHSGCFIHKTRTSSLSLSEKAHTYSLCECRHNTETALVCLLVFPYVLFLLMHDRRSVRWK